jgi:hypothetical protein
MVINVSNVLDSILGRIAIIPLPTHLTIVPSATFCTMGKHWAMSHCMKEGTMLIAQIKSKVNDTKFSLGHLTSQPIKHAQGHAIIEK